MHSNLSKNLEDKLNKLKNIISKMDSAIVAYSGGVDSSLLLKICKDILRDKVLAAIGVFMTYPKREIDFAIKTAKRINVAYRLISINIKNNKKIIRNFPDRCYWCKKELFSKIKKIAKKAKISHILDGSNYDDLFEDRAGFRAARELNIQSPLIEAKLKKDEIRQVSKVLKLSTWNKPSFSCLATRFPYKTKIDIKKLKIINAIEEYIMKFGIKQVRVRHFGDLAKIDIVEKDFKKLLEERKKIISFIKKNGYRFVVLDIEGYRQVNLNSLAING